MRYFDEKNHRLVYIEQAPTPDFWDDHWQFNGSVRERIAGIKNTYVSRVTKRYLEPKDGVILEGGCGYAQHVVALVNNGYHCIGVDSAQQTVQTLQKAVPQLDIRLGDVRHLDFRDGHFAGYWSIGVIEHFRNSYEPVGRDMARVIRPGGYLFLAFPYMSPLRRLKANLGVYPHWGNEQDRISTGFFQFALDHKSVIRDFVGYGFKLARVKPLDGLKGTKDEVGIAKRLLQALYDYRGSSIVIRGFRLALSSVLALVAGHSILMIFKRNTI